MICFVIYGENIYVSNRVVPDTDLAGYPANNFAGYPAWPDTGYPAI